MIIFVLMLSCRGRPFTSAVQVISLKNLGNMHITFLTVCFNSRHNLFLKMVNFKREVFGNNFSISKFLKIH